VLSQALATARGLNSPLDRAEALAALAPLVAEGERDQVIHETLEAASQIGPRFAWRRVRVLAALAGLVPESQRGEVLDKAVAVAKAIGDNWDRALGEALLVLQTPGEEDRWADTEWVLDIFGGGNPVALEGARLGAEILAGLAPHLPDRLLTMALAVASEISWNAGRAQMLAALVLRLSESERAEVLRGALEAFKRIDDGRERAETLARLAERLGEPRRTQALREALAVARGIKGASERALVFGEPVPRLPESERPQVLAEALAAARQIEDPELWSECLVELAALLPEAERSEVLAEALAAARQIEDPGLRSECLVELAALLPEPERTQVLAGALAAARAIEDPAARVDRLEVLAAQLAEPERSGLLGEALAAARQIEDPAVRAYKLGEMVGELPEPLRSQVIAETLSLLLADPLPPRVVPDSFLLHLPPHERSEVAARVLLASLNQEETQRLTWDLWVNLDGVVPHLLPEQSLTVFDGFARYLRARCQAGRPAILRRLDAAVIEYLGGAAAIEQTARAVADVGQWWP
jgi:hypothetical protein